MEPTEDTGLATIDFTPRSSRRKRPVAPTAIDGLDQETVADVRRPARRPGSKGLAPGMRRYTIVVPESLVERVNSEVAADWGLKIAETWEGLVMLGLEAYEAGRRPPMEDVPAAVRQLRRQ